VIRSTWAALSLAALLLGVSASYPQTYVVDGPGKLTTIANLIKTSPPGGSRHIRFQTYKDVGLFAVNGLTVDSLILERDSQSAEVLDVAGTFLDIKGASCPVVMRNLAFRITSATAILIDGIGASANKNLVVDSCIVFGDTIGTSFVSWSSKSGSLGKIELKRSIIFGLKGPDARIDLTADTVNLTNNYFNFSGLIATTSGSKLSFLNNTSNRAQFRFSGDGTGTYDISNNYFANPPVTPKFNAPSKYVANIFGFPITGSARGNKRFNTWTGFDNSAAPIFGTSENTITNAFGDSLAQWDFREVGETTRGYQYPTSANFPSFSIYPPDSLYKTRIGLDSIILSVDAASIPRVISASIASIAYPPTLDSTRTFWSKDSSLTVSGPAVVKALTLPLGKGLGNPILFAQVGSAFPAGPAGKEGELVFANGSPAAKTFIPTFGGQNTLKGAPTFVIGLSTDTVLRFSSITRTGRTRLGALQAPSARKRWRTFNQGNSLLGFRDSTNAEGSGQLKFGLGKGGFPSPLITDSLSWILPGDTLRPVLDSAGKYWGDRPFAAVSQAILIERLTLGSGLDTMPLAQGRLVFGGPSGIQLQADSSGSLSANQLADMGFFSKPLSFRWMGRQAGDSLTLEWNKGLPRQKPFTLKDGKALAVTPVREDSSLVAVRFGPGDTNQILFLARKFSIPAGMKTTIAIGSDTARDILSSKPGDLMLDTALPLAGLSTDSLRILAKRKPSLDNLNLTGTYTLVLKGLAPNRDENLRAYVLRGGKWDSVPSLRSGFFYRFTAAKDDEGYLVAEILRPLDTLPVDPASNPSVQVQGSKVVIKPVLTSSEGSRLKDYFVIVYSLDVNGRARLDTLMRPSGDSSVTIILDGSKYYSARIGYESFSGKVTWKQVPTIPQDARALLAAAAAAARPYKAAVWELSSLPWEGTPGKDIYGQFEAAARKDVHVDEWTGTWTSVADEAPLRRGHGYLVGVPSEYKPAPPTSFSFAFAPESLTLAAGWQLVASPYPFAYPEKDIEKDDQVLGYFYALSWEGTGDSAKPVWTVADTLKPFYSYAVHAKSATSLRFNPGQLGSQAPAAKRASGHLPREIRVTDGRDDIKAQLFIRPETSPRPTPALPFFTSGFAGHWESTKGPATISNQGGRAFDAAMVLNAPADRTVSMAAPAGLALWDSRTKRLLSLSESPIIQLDQGENWFRVLEVGPEDWAATEARLSLNEASRLELLPNYPNPFSGRTTLAFAIPTVAGTLSEIVLQITGLDGRIRMERRYRDIAPGRYQVPVDAGTWPAGQYVVRADLRGQGRAHRFQRLILHLGSGR
jgi:hypothetical protein